MNKIALAGAAGVGALVTVSAVSAVLYKTFLGTEERKFGEKPQQEGIDWLKMLGHKDLYIVSEDGLYLHGIAIKGKSNNWAVLVHGYDSECRGMLGHAKIFYDRGFSVFIPDQRGYGLSGDNETTMGHLEKTDIKKWTEKLIKEFNADKIILYGISMGAATVMLMSAEELPVNVRAIIEDCGYTSVKDEFEYNMSRVVKLPPYPFLWICDAMSRVRKGWSILKDADCVRAVSRSKLPILFIHGSSDTFVPFEMHDRLYSACQRDDKEKLVVYGAGHTECYSKAPEEYKKAVYDFIDKHIN